MEEMLKILYRSFLETESESSESLRIIYESQKQVDEALNELEDVVSSKLFDELYDKITDGMSDAREAAFMAGFAQCAKFMSNGKIDFFPVQNSAGGEIA